MRTSKSDAAIRIAQCAVLLVFLGGWELAGRLDPQSVFFFGSPSKIFGYFVQRAADGSLFVDTFTTLGEVVVGFIAGNVLGALLGTLLWFSPFIFRVSHPYIVVLGAAPVFALAPLLIVWFGTGILSKVMMVILSTVFVAMFQSYTGAASVPAEYLQLMKSFHASRAQVFRKVIAPSSLVWVMSAFRLNVGFAILGAFIGEFISSTQGLGHLILVASGLFDISLVLCGVFTLVAIALLMTRVLETLEQRLKRMVVRFL